MTDQLALDVEPRRPNPNAHFFDADGEAAPAPLVLRRRPVAGAIAEVGAGDVDPAIEPDPTRRRLL